MNNSSNINPPGVKCKQPDLKSRGPWRNMREAANAGKADPHAQAIKSFVVIKNPGGYTYTVGDRPVLFSFDKVVAIYAFLNGRVWSYPQFPAQGVKK